MTSDGACIHTVSYALCCMTLCVKAWNVVNSQKALVLIIQLCKQWQVTLELACWSVSACRQAEPDMYSI